MTMTRVWERLYIGSLEDAEHLFRANPQGIFTVISLCEDPVQRRRGDTNYLHHPISDMMQIPVRKFDAIIDAIAENIRWGKVLLHCAEGISRTPIMAAAYMHTVGYKKFHAALNDIRRLRPEIHPSPSLLSSVKECLR